MILDALRKQQTCFKLHTWPCVSFGIQRCALVTSFALLTALLLHLGDGCVVADISWLPGAEWEVDVGVNYCVVA